VGLTSEAKLVVKGTATDPVVFTSAATSPAAGDWSELYLGSYLMGGTTIDHATFEYAGSDQGPAIEVVSDKPGRITITNSIFQHNAAGAILAEYATSAFQDVSGNTMTDNGPWAAKINANVVGSLGAGNTFGVPIRVVDSTVMQTATWRKHDVPYWIESTVTVADELSPVLTIEPGVTLKFGMGMGLRTGVTYPGALQAKGVTFTSSAATSTAGDWQFIWFGGFTAASKLDTCTIEYGGDGTGQYFSVLTIEDTAVPKVSVVGTTFKNNLGPSDINASGACASYENASPPNTFDLPVHCN
jgi:hypothetical protein